MTKFIVIYKGSPEAWKKSEDSSPEEHKEGMKKWMEWKDKCGEGMVDMGAPLGNGQKVASSGTSSTDNTTLGYSILQAENIDGALGMLKEHPHLGWDAGCEIEVYECMPMPQ